MKPLFSVVITAYNQEKNISKSIDSVLNQTFKDFEIILVNDGSSDGTLNVLKEIASNHKNIRIINHETNKSTFMARLSGIQNAKGKYLLFLDGDDSFYEDALQKLYEEVICKEDFDVCQFSYYLMSDKKVIAPNPMDNVEPRILALSQKDTSVSFLDKLYRTELVQKAFKGVPVGYMTIAEDWYQSVCVALETKKFIQRDIPVYIYDDSNGITNRLYDAGKNEKNLKSINTVLVCLTDLLKQKSDEKTAKKILNNFEEKLYEWVLVKIKYQTKEDDIIKSFLLLPKYFSSKTIEKDFTNIFIDAVKYRNGCFSLRNFAKRIYHKIR